MKQKLLLICVCLFGALSGVKAWTSVTPQVGKSYYLHCTVYPNQFWYPDKANSRYCITSDLSVATPVYIESIEGSTYAMSFYVNGTKYYLHQKDGNVDWKTTSQTMNVDGNTSGYCVRNDYYSEGLLNPKSGHRYMWPYDSGGGISFGRVLDKDASADYCWQFISVYEVDSNTPSECATTAEASYVTAENGWERVMDNDVLDASVGDYFFAIVCANYPGLMVNMADGNSSQQAEGYSGSKSMWYSSSANPENDNSFLWMIEKCNESGYEGYTFRNSRYPTWTIQAESSSSKFAHTHDQANPCRWSSYALTPSNGVYTIKTLANGGDNYLGLWTPSNDYLNGQELAGNKGTSEQGKFLIYRLPKQRLRNVSFTANITNPSFETGDDTGWTHELSSDTGVKTSSGGYATTGIDGTYLFYTWWQGVPLSQTIGNIPNGKYRMTVSLAGSDDGKDGKYFLLAEGSHSDVITITQGTKGTFNNYSYDFIVSDNSATIGVVGGNDDGSYNENGHWWYKADNFRLTYIGQLLSDGVDAFTSPSAVTNDAWYNYTVGSAGWYVITSSAATTISYTTDATKSVGDGGFSTLELAAGMSKCLELTNDPLYFKSSAAATLTITALTSGMDVTSLVTNTTFDSDISGWTATGGFQNSQTASNQSGDFTGNFWENWNGSAKVNKMYQNITNVPNGFYKMKIAAFVNNLAENNSTQYVFVNGGKTYLVTNSPKFYEVWGQVSDNTLSIGLEQTTATANWMGIDNVSLTYFDALPESITPVTGKMNATVESAQTSAVAAYAASQTVANINAAMKARAAAEVSKAAYANAANYLESVEELLATTNFYTLDAYNIVYGTYKTAYDEGTLDDATAAGLTYKVASHTPSDQRYTDNTANDLLIPGWKIDNVDAAANQTALYINTWSHEDDRKGFDNPFYEYWIGSGSLPKTTLAGTISGLTANATYAVTANVRVQGDSKVENSIRMQVGSGTTVDVTQGNKIDGESRYVKSYTAVGSTDGSGNLTLTFTVDENSNISWLSFRDVRYEKLPSVTVSAKAGKYGTVILPFAYNFAEDDDFSKIKFYSCASVNNGYTQIEEVSTPEANTPYIIKNTGGKDFSKTISGFSVAEENSYTVGLLTGVYTDAYIPRSDASNSYYVYVLQTKDDVQAFYKVEDDEFPGTPYKCYLTISTDTPVKAFLFPENPTAINAIETAENENTEIYNLAGQRLSKAQKGVNIVNGKKVLVK